MTRPNDITKITTDSGQTGWRLEAPKADKVTIIVGQQKITIPTPLHETRDFYGAVAAALFGLAMKLGIEPEDIE